MTTSIKSRLTRIEGRAATIVEEFGAQEVAQAWRRLFATLRQSLANALPADHEAQVLALHGRLAAGITSPADRAALAHLAALDLLAAGATAAGVVALMADVFSTY